MSSVNLFSLLLLIAYFGCSVGTARLHLVAESGDLVLTTCTHTWYNSLCVSSLRSDPRSQNADLKGLARVAIDVCAIHGKHMISHITELTTQNNTSYTPYVSSCLNDCIKEYDEAVGNLEAATEALENNSHVALNSLTTAAMTDSDTCEDGFKDDNPEAKSPLTEENRHFFQLCSNALAISNLLG